MRDLLETTRRFSLFVIASLVLVAPGRALGASAGDGRYFGMRLSLGGGLFYYPQVVDGGFYIDGHPYDLTWYGGEAQVYGEAYAFMPGVPRLTVGLGGAYFRGLWPRAMDPHSGATAKSNGGAHGGFGGVGAGWWLGERGRLGLLVGDGGTGVPDIYGGYGVAVSLTAAFVRRSGDLFGGLGARFTYMHLSSSGGGSVSGEHGGYMTLMIEGTFDWAPTLGDAAGSALDPG